MSALILHLSDIHIENNKDFVLLRAKSIACTLNQYLSAATAVFIIVSGDIVQSGLKAEYDIALCLLKSIEREIKKEKDISVEFITVPGNHDCDFSGDQAVRNAILKDLPNHIDNMPESLVAMATQVQDNYFEFRNNLISKSSLVHDDRLWTVQEFNIEGKTIWFDSLNVAWISTRSEKQGSVIYPYETYKKIGFKPGDADLRIGIMHHPLNWFGQVNYQGFRNFLHSLSDAIFTGHEHTGTAGLRVEAGRGDCVYIEGCALQVRHGTDSAFNLLELTFDPDQFAWEKYELIGERYQGAGREMPFLLRTPAVRNGSEFQITEKFLMKLKDPGATLHHPDKKELELDDFYVFPDLDSKSNEGRKSSHVRSMSKKRSSKTLTLIEHIEPNIILEGEESSGKTRLLYQLFRSYHLQNLLPVYLDGRQIKSAKEDELRKLFSHAVIEQYGKANLDAFNQASSERKVLLIDDFDQIPLQGKFKDRIYEFIATGYRTRILTVGENFELSELIVAEKLDHLASYVHLEILPFGYERRGELVKKWNRLGMTEVTTNNEWLHACTQAEQLIETARLQHVATTVPIMVLSLLQVGTSGIAKEMHNSSFAHYFYFLIVGALQNAGISKESLGKKLAFATHFSWYMKCNGLDHEISEDQFKIFCASYSKEWTTADPEETLAIFIRARILDKRGDAIGFTYQYAYYFFLGRYTNSFNEHEDVKAYLAFCINNLYVRECANTLLFLAHHSDNSIVLDGVMEALTNHFVESVAVTFLRDDVATVSQLISSAPMITYSPRNPIEHRQEMHRFQDENDTGNDGLAASPKPQASERDFIDEITSIAKTMEIAGVLLTNQFSSLTRDKKNLAVKLVFESGLKVINSFYSLFDRNPERLVKELTDRMRSKKRDLTMSEAETQARHAIAWVLKLVSTGWIEKAGAHLTSPELMDNVTDVIIGNPSPAMKLIRISQQLARPGTLPQAALKAIIKEEKDNPCVMSVLQLLVLKRLYMYDVEHSDKHWAISTFQLGRATNTVELAHRQQKFGNRAASPQLRRA